MTDFVNLSMVVLMLSALGCGFLHRWLQNASITHRFIQFLGISWLVGATVILAREQHIDSADTILGALAGYLFAMARHDGQARKKESPQIRVGSGGAS